MMIGCCTSIENYDEIAALGYQAIDLAGKTIAAMTDAEFALVKEKIRNGPLVFANVNASFPPEVKLNGPMFQPKELMDYTIKLCNRVRELGGKSIGIGSPNSRTVPEGYSFERAMAEFEEAVSLICSIAATRRLDVCLEACCSLETNFIMRTQEAYAVVKRLRIPNLHLVYDIYHAYMMEEDPALIREVFSEIGCVHVSKPVSGKRYYPDAACMEMFAPYITELKTCGYQGELATEAFDGDFSEGVKSAIEVLCDL